MKSIRESWQHFLQVLKKPGWFYFRLILFVIVFVLFSVLLLWGEPITHFLDESEHHSIQAVLVPASGSASPVEIPPEVISINNQINLDVFGAVILVLLITVGTLMSIIQKKVRPATAGKGGKHYFWRKK